MEVDLICMSIGPSNDPNDYCPRIFRSRIANHPRLAMVIRPADVIVWACPSIP